MRGEGEKPKSAQTQWKNVRLQTQWKNQCTNFKSSKKKTERKKKKEKKKKKKKKADFKAKVLENVLLHGVAPQHPSFLRAAMLIAQDRVGRAGLQVRADLEDAAPVGLRVVHRAAQLGVQHIPGARQVRQMDLVDPPTSTNRVAELPLEVALVGAQGVADLARRRRVDQSGGGSDGDDVRDLRGHGQLLLPEHEDQLVQGPVRLRSPDLELRAGEKHVPLLHPGVEVVAVEDVDDGLVRFRDAGGLLRSRVARVGRGVARVGRLVRRHVAGSHVYVARVGRLVRRHVAGSHVYYFICCRKSEISRTHTL